MCKSSGTYGPQTAAAENAAEDQSVSAVQLPAKHLHLRELSGLSDLYEFYNMWLRTYPEIDRYVGLRLQL